MTTALYTQSEAAKLIGCDKSTVSRLCARLGLGQRLGTVIVLTAAQVERLKSERRPVGNPNMTPGNYFAGAKKRRKRREK